MNFEKVKGGVGMGEMMFGKTAGSQFVKVAPPPRSEPFNSEQLQLGNAAFQTWWSPIVPIKSCHLPLHFNWFFVSGVTKTCLQLDSPLFDED